MTSPDLLRDPVASDPLRPDPGGPDGFFDCRGEWHPWAEEEE